MFEKCLEYYSIKIHKKHIWELIQIPKSTFYKLVNKNGLKLEHYKIICNTLKINLTDNKKIIIKKITDILYE